MIKAYKNFWKLALKSEGTSSRSDYWWTFLINSIIRAVIILIYSLTILSEFMKRVPHSATASQVQQVIQEVSDNPPTSATIAQIVGTVFSLLIMVPVTTLTARRLRDAGYPAGLAYPLPAIYLANVVSIFVNITVLDSLLLFTAIYAIVVLILCARATQDPEEIERY